MNLDKNDAPEGFKAKARRSCKGCHFEGTATNGCPSRPENSWTYCSKFGRKDGISVIFLKKKPKLKIPKPMYYTVACTKHTQLTEARFDTPNEAAVFMRKQCQAGWSVDVYAHLDKDDLLEAFPEN